MHEDIVNLGIFGFIYNSRLSPEAAEILKSFYLTLRRYIYLFILGITLLWMEFQLLHDSWNP